MKIKVVCYEEFEKSCESLYNLIRLCKDEEEILHYLRRTSMVSSWEHVYALRTKHSLRGWQCNNNKQKNNSNNNK